MIPNQSDLFSSDDGTIIRAIPSMSLSYPKLKKDGTYSGHDKNGCVYSIKVEDTDLIHSKTKRKGYRVHFNKTSTIISFITYQGSDIDSIINRLQKIGYVIYS